jgi:hypothetical protein
VATVVQHDLVVQLHADTALLVYLSIDRPLALHRAISSPLTLQADLLPPPALGSLIQSSLETIACLEQLY